VNSYAGRYQLGLAWFNKQWLMNASAKIEAG